MRKINFYYLIIIVTFYSCATKAQKSNTTFEQCIIAEESFEATSMKKFLNTATFQREILDKFINSSSSYSVLSIENEDVIFASLNENIWNVLYNGRSYKIENNELTLDVKFYAEKNIVYKVSCPDNFKIYDSNEPFRAVWIKKESAIKFLYYSTKCEKVCLNADEQKKITSLKSIIAQLKN